jgi:O-antigen ligase
VVYVPVLRARFLFSFQSGGDAARFSIWNSAWLMIKEHPFLGKGLGTFMDYFRFYSSGYLSPQYAHNCYLQMWAESGFFSLLSFIALITVILYQAIKTLKNKSDFFTLGLACSILGFLVHSFFDTQLYSLQLAVFFWVLLGMLVAQIKAVKNPA